MKNIRHFCKVFGAFAIMLWASVSVAGTSYHIRTAVGAKIGEVAIETKNMRFMANPGHHRNTDQSMRLNISIFTEPARPLSRLIASSRTYERYTNYVAETTGSDSFVRGAPLYGHLEALLKSRSEIQKAQRIFSAHQVIAEVFEGTQNGFWYFESYKNGRPVLDSKSCTYDFNSPLWTVRFKANGEAIELPYSSSNTVVSSTYMNGVGRKFFPATRFEQINGESRCLQELRNVQANPAVYEFIYPELFAVN